MTIVCLSPAAIDKSGREVSPDDRAFCNSLEIIRQQTRKAFRACEYGLAMQIGKRDKPAARFQDAHHGIETLHLQRFRKGSPRDSGYDAVHRLNSRRLTDVMDVGDAVMKQTDTRIT